MTQVYTNYRKCIYQPYTNHCIGICTNYGIAMVLIIDKSAIYQHESVQAEI